MQHLCVRRGSRCFEISFSRFAPPSFLTVTSVLNASTSFLSASRPNFQPSPYLCLRSFDVHLPPLRWRICSSAATSCSTSCTPAPWIPTCPSSSPDCIWLLRTDTPRSSGECSADDASLPPSALPSQPFVSTRAWEEWCREASPKLLRQDTHCLSPCVPCYPRLRFLRFSDQWIFEIVFSCLKKWRNSMR